MSLKNLDVYDYLNSVQEYDVKERVGKTAGEAILLGETDPNAEPEVPPVPPPEEPPEQPKESISDIVQSLKSKFDLKKFKQLVLRVFVSIPEGLSAFKKSFADLIVAFYFKDPNTREAKIANSIVQHQIQRYFIIPITFWVALNWWYVWNYTNFHFNFTDALSFAPLKVGYYVFEPTFVVLEFFNYYLLSMRMDQSLTCSMRERLEGMWNWRPVVFTIFAFSTASMLHSMPFSDTLSSSVTGQATIITSILFLATIFAYVYLTCTCTMRLFSFNHMLGNILIVIFVLLLFLLFVLVFSGFGTLLLMSYLVFFSYFVLVVFERFNFPWKISEMLNDLTKAPVNEPDVNKFKKPFTYFKQMVFRNFFKFAWMIFGVIPVFILHMVEISQLKSKEMMATLMIATVGLNAFIAMPAVEIFQQLGEVFMNMFSSTTSFNVSVPPLDAFVSTADAAGSTAETTGDFIKNASDYTVQAAETLASKIRTV